MCVEAVSKRTQLGQNGVYSLTHWPCCFSMVISAMASGLVAMGQAKVDLKISYRRHDAILDAVTHTAGEAQIGQTRT